MPREEDAGDARADDVATPRYSLVMAARKLAPGNQLGRASGLMSRLDVFMRKV